MSGRLDPISTKALDAAKPTPEEIEKYLSRTISLGDRKFLPDRFTIPGVDPSIHYEWHRADPATRQRLMAKGFKVDHELAKGSDFVHTDGEGNPVNGDVICYSKPTWQYEIDQKLERERQREKADPSRTRESLAERLREDNLIVTSDAGLVSRTIDNNEIASIVEKIQTPKE